MSQEIVNYIKSNLRSMYPMYRFEVTNSQDGTKYNISVFKGTGILSAYTAFSTTPRDVFWQNIQTWMKPVIATYR
jgi:fluoride ion exporter CrcB/FEX